MSHKRPREIFTQCIPLPPDARYTQYYNNACKARKFSPVKLYTTTTLFFCALVGCSGGTETRLENSNAGNGNTVLTSSNADIDIRNSGNTNDETTFGGLTTANGTGGESEFETGNTINNSSTAVAGLSARHRNGQTFLTWSEVAGSVQYHVYRHTSPITSDNLSSATRLTERWGPLDENTTVNIHGTDGAPSHFVIENLAAPLSDDTGLFVHTTQNGQNGNTYYAVTSVVNGTENISLSAGSNTLASAITEIVSTPRPVLTASVNDGKGRLYTQFMDYANWNPTLEGYIYNYAVALPFNYDPSRTYPLQVELHAFGEPAKFIEQAPFNWEMIQIFPSDPGAALNSIHTWWYGFATDHNYKTQGRIPFQGTVTNFTQQRIIKAVNDVIEDTTISADANLLHAVGHSMGASGVLSLGIHYGEKFAGIYGSEPMTNYATSPSFQDNFIQLWGEQSNNLPIVNGGPDSNSIRRYGVGGSQPTGVWDWMNHLAQVKQRRADTFSYLMVDHGKDDTVIDWQTQGKPVPKAFNEANIGFSAGGIANIGHTWLGFSAIVRTVFGYGFDEFQAWRYENNQSFPAISFASGAGAIDPGASVTDEYNQNIEWSTSRFAFHQSIVDESNRYAITLRSTASEQTASITPRNTRSFRPSPGVQCSWSAIRISDGQSIGAGTASADNSALVTVSGVPIGTGVGTRLTINC